MSLVRINWKPDSREIRKFGVSMIVGFALIGGFFWWKEHLTAAGYCLAFGAFSGLLGLSGTKAALPVYWAWMAIAFVMGNIMSRVILALFYYLVITPMGLCMQWGGRDKLTLRRRETESYWVPVKPTADKKRYERQF